MRRKILSVLIVALMLFAIAMPAVATEPAENAAVASQVKKVEASRAIAIVFDNSGSMYAGSNKAWSHATYAMEVFASMLNKGDTLQIYPMHSITVNGQAYTMDNPFVITDASQASSIRGIYTSKPGGTPIKSIDAAIAGIAKVTADKKYMLVLTDGDKFDMSRNDTIKGLDERFVNAGPAMSMMYLGIGNNTAMPTIPDSEYFIKRQAKNSADTLSILTEMCNKIFGRDTMPKSHLSGNNINLDISASKLIAFVQGKDISELKVTGGGANIGTLEGAVSTKYATNGCGIYKSVPDESLQGMMVTYTDCGVGNYTIEYKGSATSVEVYYEPDADLDFVFTDAEGNLVDPNALYEGEYKVSFGMKDRKTGQLITSDLLGTPHYEGSYTINGEKKSFEENGKSGEVAVSLKNGDKFEANLTVTYLSGYTITKDSTDFGWPEGGISVIPKPAGDFKLKISGGSGKYSLQELDKGEPFVAEVYYQDVKLTGAELEKVVLEWKPETSFAEIKSTFAEDHYKLSLSHKDPGNPTNTTCGECKVAIAARYTPQGSEEAKAQATLTYKIDDDFNPIQIKLTPSEDYIVISDLGNNTYIDAELSMKGKPLTAEEFKATVLTVDAGGIKYEAVPDEATSSYTIKLLPTDGIDAEDYEIKVTAKYTDKIGRETQSKETVMITLSDMPLWLKWLIGISLLLLILILIWMILHTRVLPKRVRHNKFDCGMRVTGKDVAEGTDFNAKVSGKQLSARVVYGGNSAGITISNLRPGKESYRYKPSHKRSMIADPNNVKMFGDVTRADINGATFVLDRKEGVLVPEDPDMKPFIISNNANVSFEGTMEENGRSKKFNAEIPLTFKKK